MKTVFAILIMLVMVFSLFVPAQAAKPAAALTVTSQGTAMIGQTILVTLSASTDVPDKFEWEVSFHPNAVTDVSVYLGGEQLTPSVWKPFTYGWAGFLKKDSSAQVTFSVTLSQNPGLQPLFMVIKDGSDIVMTNIELLEPSLVWNVVAPASVIYGGRPFQVVISVDNPNSQDLPFDVKIRFSLNGIRRMSGPVLNGGEIYFGEPGTWWWRGNVPAGQTFTIAFTPYSGSVIGALNLLTIQDLLLGKELASVGFALIPSGGTAYGEFSLPDHLLVGQTVELKVEMFGPQLSQFVMKPITSECWISGLPAGEISVPDVTYASFSYYFTVPPVKVGESMVCYLNTNFYFYGKPEMLYNINTSFLVTKE